MREDLGIDIALTERYSFDVQQRNGGAFDNHVAGITIGKHVSTLSRKRARASKKETEREELRAFSRARAKAVADKKKEERKEKYGFEDGQSK